MSTPPEEPMCRQHKVPMELRPIHRQSAEERWCGAWYDCPALRCHNSYLRPSAALLAQNQGSTP